MAHRMVSLSYIKYQDINVENSLASEKSEALQPHNQLPNSQIHYRLIKMTHNSKLGKNFLQDIAKEESLGS